MRLDYDDDRDDDESDDHDDCDDDRSEHERGAGSSLWVGAPSIGDTSRVCALWSTCSCETSPSRCSASERQRTVIRGTRST